MTRAIIYTRVSSKDQAESTLGLRAQMAACREYCVRHGLKVVGEVVDDGDGKGTSASQPLHRRRGGKKLLEQIIAAGEVGAIVTLRLDRMFRRVRDCVTHVEEWQNRGVALHLVDFGGESLNTAGATGKFILHIMAAVAQFESEIDGERTAAALGEAKKQGKKLGLPRFGFQSARYFDEEGKKHNAGVQIEHPEQQRAISRARELATYCRKRRSGRVNYSRIARVLETEGFKTSLGGQWTHMQVKSMLPAARS